MVAPGRTTYSISVTNCRRTFSADLIEAGAKALEKLRHIDAIAVAIERYYTITQVMTFSGPMASRTLRSLSETFKQFRIGQANSRARDLSAMLFENTSHPLDLREGGVGFDQMHMLFTGSNLRWETICLISSIAGRASAAFSERDIQLATKDMDITCHNDFQGVMTEVSNACLGFCDHSGGAVNELLVLDTSENLTLLTMHYGDSSKFIPGCILTFNY